jgi:hypothetical protein
MRRCLLLMLLVVSTPCLAGYDPLGVATSTPLSKSTAPRVSGYDPLGLLVLPVVPTAPPVQRPACITVDGVDYDLDTILSEYTSPWTWPTEGGQYGGKDEKSLRLHLSSDGHQVTGIENLDFETLKKVHAVLHEREEALAASKHKPVPKVKPAPPRAVQGTPRASGPCPGGVCPAPQQYYQPEQRQGFFRRLFGS